MDSIVAIGVGLVLRVAVDFVTDNDDRVGGVLVGLWEGVVLSHFVRRMPRSFDPYIGFGFRIFVDFLFTQSISRLALVALWALVGMLLADMAPIVWRDSGLKYLYRQVQKDVRHVKRAVPRIRIENDLPSVRLFSKSRSASSGSVRSDRAAPSRSTAPSPAPSSGPARRPGRTPPGTYPDVSGWSETATDVSVLRERTTSLAGPSPSPVLIPSREDVATYERIETTRVAATETRTTAVESTTVTIAQTRNESVLVETVVSAAAAAQTLPVPVAEPPRIELPPIQDDWIDIDHPTPAQANEPVVPFLPDPEPVPSPAQEVQPDSMAQAEPEPEPAPPPTQEAKPVVQPQPDPEPNFELQPAPPTPAPSQPASILIPPTVVGSSEVLARPPEEIPLPESRAASVIGGVFDQPQPRSLLRDSARSRVDKATSEIGVEYSKSVSQSVSRQSTKSRSMLGWFGRSKPSNDADADAPDPPPKKSLEKAENESKLDVSSGVQKLEPQIPTPAQVDPPANILTHPGDTPPLLLAQVDPEPKQREQSRTSQSDLPPPSAGVDSSPAPREGVADKGPSKTTSLFDLPSPSRSPPPPFSEFAGVPPEPAAGETSAEQDPVTQDEPVIELTEAQKAAEKKRIAFLSIQIKELERSHTDLQRKLDKQDDPSSSTAKAIKSDLDDAEKTLDDAKARLEKKKFSEPPSEIQIQEISVAGKSMAEATFILTSAILNELLARDDAGPITIHASVPKKGVKKMQSRDALTTLAKRHGFETQFTESAGILKITF